MVSRILGWAHGSPAEPPELYKHLLRKNGQVYSIQDQDFVTFLVLFYDPNRKEIVFSGSVFLLAFSITLSHDQLVPSALLVRRRAPGR
jgi:hypothetical protein